MASRVQPRASSTASRSLRVSKPRRKIPRLGEADMPRTPGVFSTPSPLPWPNGGAGGRCRKPSEIGHIGSTTFNIERQERGYKQVIEKCLSTAPEQLRQRRNEIIGNRYRLLTFDVLGRGINRRQCWVATRYLWTALKYQPRFLKDNVTWVVMAKIIVGLVLPGSAAKVVLYQIRNLYPRNNQDDHAGHQ